MKSKKPAADHPSTIAVEFERQCPNCGKHLRETPTGPITILRLPKVLERTGLSRSTVLEMVKRGSNSYGPPFPAPIQITAGCKGWPSHEIDSWIAKVTNFCRQPLK